MSKLTSLLEWFSNAFKGIGGSDPIQVSVSVPIQIPSKSCQKMKLLRPVPDKFRISSPFGERTDPFNRARKVHHNGVDFGVPVGTEVKAGIDGRVLRAGWENPSVPEQGFGQRVWIEFKFEGEAYYLWYGHLSEVKAKEGDAVKVGDVVGLSGNTGSSTGPHLHVQLRKKNTGTFFDLEFYNDTNATLAQDPSGQRV